MFTYANYKSYRSQILARGSFTGSCNQQVSTNQWQFEPITIAVCLELMEKPVFGSADQ